MLMTRKMFTECKLVHADLSEYNILYHVDDNASTPGSAVDPSSDTAAASTSEEQSSPPFPPRGHLCIIDVSQSVEHDHPHAFDFLRSDLRNIEDFFSKRGVRTVGLRRAFEFVTRDQLPRADGQTEEAALRQWMDQPETEEDIGADGPTSNGKADEDEVFMRSYIPRTLNEVYDPERDVGVLSRGEGEKLIYKDTIGIVAPAKSTKDGRDGAVDGNAKSQRAQSKSVSFADDGEAEAAHEVDEELEEEESEDESEEESSGFKEKKPRGHRHEDKEAKKVRPIEKDNRQDVYRPQYSLQERKKAAKEEAREKRKHKIPKAEKKRKIKATARGG